MQATTINALNPDNPDTLVSEKALTQDAIEAFLYSHSFTKYNNLAIQAKTTTSTGIVAKTAPKPSMDHLSAQFHRYPKVFSEQESHRLPQHQP